MNRREFAASALALWTAPLGVVATTKPKNSQPLRVNTARLLDHLQRLAEFGKNPDGGVSRVAYSDADLAGRAYVMALMADAGLAPTVDAAGNIIGHRGGDDSLLPPLMLGSHID